MCVIPKVLYNSKYINLLIMISIIVVECEQLLIIIIGGWTHRWMTYICSKHSISNMNWMSFISRHSMYNIHIYTYIHKGRHLYEISIHRSM